MGIPSLPTELWAEIAKEETLNTEDYYSLTLVDRRFRDIFTPALYSSIGIHIGIHSYLRDTLYSSPDASRFELVDSRLQRLLDLFVCSPLHRQFVHQVDFRTMYPPPVQLDENIKYSYFDELTESIMALIAWFPSLQVLKLSYLRFELDSILRLVSSSSSGLLLEMYHCFITGEATINVQSTLSSLACYKLPIKILVPLISGASLRELHIGISLGQLESALKRYNLSLTSLRSLSVPDFTNGALNFFKNTPDLSKLSIRRDSTSHDDSPLPLHWKNMLTRLEHFSGQKDFIPLFVSSRPVVSIDCREYEALPPDLGPLFGSQVVVRDIQWSSDEPWEILPYLVKHNPKVQDLCIYTFWRPGAPNKKNMPRWTEEIKKLKQLQALTLVISLSEQEAREIEKKERNGRRSPGIYGYYPPITSPALRKHAQWEMEQCEKLRTGGCPDLVYVAFSGGYAWGRHPDDFVWSKRELLYPVDW